MFQPMKLLEKKHENKDFFENYYDMVNMEILILNEKCILISHKITVRLTN